LPLGEEEPTSEIPPLLTWTSNPAPSAGRETLSGGQFDWGGRLLKCNGGAHKVPSARSVIAPESAKAIREPDCERDSASRCESRT
jgi:hypothetical protein